MPPRLCPSTKTRSARIPVVSRIFLAAATASSMTSSLTVKSRIVAIRRGVRPGALVISQHRDPTAGQALGQIAKRFVRSERFVAIVWSGAMDQHHAGKRSGADRPRERSRERPASGIDSEFFVSKGRRGDVGGRRVGDGRLGWPEADADDAIERVERDSKVDDRALERAGHEHDAKSALRLRMRAMFLDLKAPNWGARLGTSRRRPSASMAAFILSLNVGTGARPRRKRADRSRLERAPRGPATGLPGASSRPRRRSRMITDMASSKRQHLAIIVKQFATTMRGCFASASCSRSSWRSSAHPI